MRLLLVLIFTLAISACAATSDDIFEEAVKSGDFAAYKRHLAKEEARLTTGQSCYAGFIPLCTEQSSSDNCSCVSLEFMNDRARDKNIEALQRQREMRRDRHIN